MISSYLSNIGIKEKDLPWYWHPSDPREKHWLEMINKHGFDERDTWDLNYTLALLIYPRLKMYDEVNRIDTSFHKFEFEDKEYTEQECINKILEGFEIFLTKNEFKLTDEDYKKIKDSMTLLGIIWWALWW